jgi:hypothetical protein
MHSSGHSLALRLPIAAAVVALVAGVVVGATTDDLVFMHHSCGRNWLESVGNPLEAALLAKDYIDERNDIYYGTDMPPDSGRPDSLASTPGDHTNMNHWIRWFNDYLGRVKDHATATGVNRIIMFKSCYPISNIGSTGSAPGNPFTSTQTTYNYRSVYQRQAGATAATYIYGGYTYKPLEEVFAENPDTLFIPVTAPPRHYSGSTDAEAARARAFNNWLRGEWLDGYNAANPELNNVAVFDWFDVLANANDCVTWANRLKAAYGGTTSNSHPNDVGNNASTALFATNTKNFLDEAYYRFAYDQGDATCDGVIDGADLALWQQSYDPLGSSASTNRWIIGDWNGDGAVDGADLALWQQNYDPLGTGLSEVPEPATLALIAMGAGLLSVVRRRRLA